MNDRSLFQPESPIGDSLFTDLDVVVERDAPIGIMTWYRIGGCADLLVRPKTVDALSTLLQRTYESDIRVRVMGSGANLLIDDAGISGVVVLLDQPAFRSVSTIHRHRKNRGSRVEAGDGIRVMAGAQLERLVVDISRKGMSGLEMMAGIPSSLGGAVRMNAGGKFGCIGDSVASVGVLDFKGDLIVRPREEIDFEYRRCSLIDPVILWAELTLEPDDPTRVYQKVKDIFAFKKTTQPLAAHSAGCVFKNPLDRETTNTHTTDEKRISAGALIDRVGLKRYTIGGAEVSQRHANFIVAHDGCTASDIINLMKHIQDVTQCETGYKLEPELVIWKRSAAERTQVGKLQEGEDV